MTVLMWCDSEGITAPVHVHQCNSEQAFDSSTLEEFLSATGQMTRPTTLPTTPLTTLLTTLQTGGFLRWLVARAVARAPQVAQLQWALAHQ